MHRIAVIVVVLALGVFVASVVVGFVSAVGLMGSLRRSGPPRPSGSLPLGPPPPDPGARHLQRFALACAAGTAAWLVAAIVGMAADLFH